MVINTAGGGVSSAANARVGTRLVGVSLARKFFKRPLGVADVKICKKASLQNNANDLWYSPEGLN